MNNRAKIVYIGFLSSTLLVSCNNTSIEKFNTPEGKEIRQKVDKMVIDLDSNISNFNQVARIDHSRFAEDVGVYTPPSIVTIFSNAMVNSNLIKKNQLIGLDEIKVQFHALTAQLQQQSRQSTDPALDLCHFAFLGNQGTGKTTVARKLGKAMRAIGRLKKGHLVEVDAVL